MTNALSLNHATLLVPDIERQIAYYEEVIGLSVVDKRHDRAHLGALSGTDALILSKSDHAALTGLAFIGDPGRARLTLPKSSTSAAFGMKSAAMPILACRRASSLVTLTASLWSCFRSRRSAPGELLAELPPCGSGMSP